MMKNAKTYLTRIQAAATERELTGIEIAFKQDMSINCDDLGTMPGSRGQAVHPAEQR